MKDKKKLPGNTSYWVLGAIALIVIISIFFDHALTSHIAWTELKNQISNDEVNKLELEGDTITIHYGADADASRANETATAIYVESDSDFLGLAEEHQVSFEALPPSLFDKYAGLFQTFILLGFFIYIFSRIQQLNPTRSSIKDVNAQLNPEDHQPVRFTDVAGVDEAIDEVQELVEFLMNPSKYTNLGGKIPKGVLLVGPPGTGKTLLAKAIAGEADVPFFRASGSDFVELYVGVGAARVRDLFKKARAQAPCIIFVDELDAIGKKRISNSIGGGSEEREQTLNQILVELDGFDARNGIIVIAATNRPETLDKALLRPGRFDRQVVVDLPDLKGREQILNVHASTILLSDTVDLKQCAQLTTGFSGADLANILNEAALLAARKNKNHVEFSDIEAAIERSIAGLKKTSRRLNLSERNIIAVHECGHAICATASENADPVHKISIIPRGLGALGFTLQTPTEDKHLHTLTELKSRLVTLYGGRVAEEIYFGEVTTGAVDDIKRATHLAARMVYELGMSQDIGAIAYPSHGQSPYELSNRIGQTPSPMMAQSLETAHRELLLWAYQESTNIIQSNQGLLEKMREEILKVETLSGDVLKGFLTEVHSSRN